MTSRYAEGLRLYRQQHWDAAIAKFDQALEIVVDDGPAQTMRLRCQEYKQDPPPKDWNGSYTMKTK